MPSHRITGLDEEQMEELASRLETRIKWDQGKGRPRKLTLRQALRSVVLYERQNITQEVIAWIYGVSQPYISNMIKFFESHIETVLAEFVPDPADTLPDRVSCIDGTLLPCWSYQGHSELYSGKHHTTGHVVQVASDLAGDVRAISDPYPGSWHDVHAYAETGWAEHVGDDGGIGDKGICRNRSGHAEEETPRWGAVEPGQGLQQRDQQASLRSGTGNLPRQILADLSHRLPETTPHLRSSLQNNPRSLLLQHHFLISLLESVSFVIDRPANIEQAVQDESQMARVVGPDSELIYPVDVTVLNSGNQAAVIAEISVEFTDIFELEYCGTKAQGGGGGLFVSALYDFEFENLTAAAELPVDITQSTRLEVPAHENTRFELSIGPKYMSETELLYVYVFNIYLREAGTDTKVILGQGASLSSVESADAFIGQIPELARGYEECMRRNAGEISRIVALPDATSPKLTELDNALKRYR